MKDLVYYIEICAILHYIISSHSRAARTLASAYPTALNWSGVCITGNAVGEISDLGKLFRGIVFSTQ